MTAAAVLDFEETVAISVIVDQSLPNLVAMLQPQRRMHLSCRKITVIKVKDAAAAIMHFEKQLPCIRYFTNSHQIWQECCEFDWERICDLENGTWTIQDGGYDHFGYQKTVAICSLFDQSSPNLLELLRIWLRTHMSCRKKAQWPKFKITVQQDWDCRLVNLCKVQYEKTSTVYSLFDQFSPNQQT